MFDTLLHKIMPQEKRFGKRFCPVFPYFSKFSRSLNRWNGKFMYNPGFTGAYCKQQNLLERVYQLMKDKKLLLATLLLPITVLFAGAALSTGLQAAQNDSAVPVAQNVEGETCVGVPIELTLSASDADGDIVLYQLTEQPRLGEVSVEGSTLSYAPGQKTGTDKFSYTAVDANGNTAKAAQITIKVVKNRSKLTYADMDGNPAHYAAIKLSECGVMTGESIGGCAFFRPNQTVSRSEFIAMASVIAALPVTPTAQTDFADDGGLSPWAKPFVSTAAASGLVSGYQTAGGLNEIRGENPITLAEAGVVVNNLLRQSLDGARFTLSAEHASDMDWAQAAVHELDRLDVLSPLAALQQPDEAITRQTACDLLYRAMCLLD